jgi:hypothetical protein
MFGRGKNYMVKETTYITNRKMIMSNKDMVNKHLILLKYAFKEDGTAASLEEFYEIYNNVKQLDVGLVKVQRPQSEFSDGPPCIELMSINKIPEKEEA